MRLIFEDYFNTLDNWNFEEGFIRNHELQYYTNQNIELTNGLKIYGKKESIENVLYDADSDDWRKNRKYSEFTSSSINTKGKFDFKYGVLEVKAKIPTADGSWPAIWLLGYEEDYPFCDEVDVMEYYMYGDNPSILANFMWSNKGERNWSTKQVSIDYFINKDSDWINKYHIWKLDWQENYMRIYIDDELINELNIKNIKGNKFKKKYYILLNLAIGKNGLRPKDSDLPLIYEIEYVKVYQNEN